MQYSRFSTFAVSLAGIALVASTAVAQDASRAIEGGGISVPGWMGKIDAGEASRGAVLENSKLARDGNMLHVTTGPAVVYWNPSNTASGSYTVSATFNEPEYMNRNNHPHPYGIVIGGNDMGTDQMSLLYCAAYGTGRFIVRGFGPQPFQISERRPTQHEAVNQAAGQGEPVTQEIAVTVTSNEVSCAINGTVVATYPKSAIIGEGKLKSTDGVYGIRFGHNTEGMVTGLRMTRR